MAQLQLEHSDDNREGQLTKNYAGPIAQLRLERTPDKREVTGSTPVRPTLLWCFYQSQERRSRLLKQLFKWGCSSVGRAPPLQGGGRRFDSDQLHKRKNFNCSLSI